MNKSVSDFQGSGFGSAIINIRPPASNLKANKNQPEEKNPLK